MRSSTTSVAKGDLTARKSSTCRSSGLFQRWVGDRELTTLTPADVDLFLRDCEAAFELARGRSLSRATVRGKIAALRSFFDYLERMGLLVDEGGAVASESDASDCRTTRRATCKRLP